MNVVFAYVVVILIWSTTPLGIKLSVGGGEPFTPLVGRTAIGLLISLVCLAFMSTRICFSMKAWKLYCASALSIVGSMALTYQGANYVKSGMIAVIYGLSPIATGVLAALILGESALRRIQLLGVFIAILGLLSVFGSEISVGGESWKGILYLVYAVLLYATSAVLVKYFDSGMNPLAVNGGSLMVALPLLILLAHEGDYILLLTDQTVLTATLYLGVVGSFFGFVLFFYVLQSMSATNVMMIPLITPLLALVFGNIVSGETVALSTLAGSLTVLLGLCIYLMHDHIHSLLRKLPKQSKSASM